MSLKNRAVDLLTKTTVVTSASISVIPLEGGYLIRLFCERGTVAVAFWRPKVFLVLSPVSFLAFGTGRQPAQFRRKVRGARVAPFRLDGDFLWLPPFLPGTKRNQWPLGVPGNDRCRLPRDARFRLDQCHRSFDSYAPRTPTDEKDKEHQRRLVTPIGIYMLAGALVILARILRLLAGKFVNEVCTFEYREL